MSEPAELVGAAPGYAIWVGDKVFGMSVWGPHTASTVESFYADVERSLERVGPAWDYVADTHLMRLGDHDWRSVTRGLRWARANRARLEHVTRRWVAVAPGHAMGWAIVGSQRMLGMRFPSYATTSIDEALALLERSDRAELGAWLSALPDRVRAQTADIAKLRQLLSTTPLISLGEAARGLGLGERSLQRLLAEHGTTFRREVGLVRPKRATPQNS